ncbi:hypothetical protein [Cellulomonas massiliensis]|uniref:hypothetical protein n=1 Tax=Cellulomonas massiliensis TaxID=1465811 RepID=UPI0002DDF3E2|nr:hypothetical protein [Cellulomonas massiliensis]
MQSPAGMVLLAAVAVVTVFSAWSLLSGHASHPTDPTSRAFYRRWRWVVVPAAVAGLVAGAVVLLGS